MLANQHQLVDMLANTPAIRRLAQMTHYAYRRATVVGEKKMDELLKNENKRMGNEYQQPQNATFAGFCVRFLKNLQTEFEKANKLKPK